MAERDAPPEQAPSGSGPERAAEADVVVDAIGMLCPLPIIELGKAARGREPGTVITVLATDMAARLDVPAWARLTGNVFVAETKKDGAALALTVRLV